jgi:hypothetical protein
VITNSDELIGVYDADGTLVGEVSYWIGARLGRRHCSLCDVTHGLVSEKASWRDCKAELPLPFVTYHRNDMPEDVRRVAQGSLPTVFVRRQGIVSPLLSPSEIEAAEGDPQGLVRLINEKLGA